VVKGLEIFGRHFSEFRDRYVLIGGTACDLVMDEAGLEFRATKDLDIVLCVEALDAEFVKAFWQFVSAGGYQVYEQSTGQKKSYRFHKPTNTDYPFMLELFSRAPDALQVAPDNHLTPLPMKDEISSLSAILLDDDYYAFIVSGRKELQGIPLLGAEHLIPLKARAWLDLTQKREAGHDVDSKSIKKHKNDVFRLYQIIDPDIDWAAPEKVKRDLQEFVLRMADEEVDLKALGIGAGTKDDILGALREFYGLD
jgi:hypothetical protein